MTRLRSILPAVALSLLLGFAVASMEDTFFCADEAAQSAPCEMDCCLQCLTLHTMGVSKKTVSISTPPSPETTSFIPSDYFPYQDPLLANIDRPPIFHLS